MLTVATWLGPNDPDIGLVSLLAQSWANLEIVVTGRPTEHPSWPILSADPRVRIAPDDDGTTDAVPIVDRTRPGEFVTIASPSVWSHPQRFEAQLGGLMGVPSCRVAVCSRVVLGERLMPRPLGWWADERLIGPHPALAVWRSGPDDEDLSDLIDAAYSPSAGVLASTNGIEVVAPDVPLAIEMWRDERPDSAT